MSRTHVEILGVQIPLRGLAFVTSTPPRPYILFREWVDRAMLKALFDPTPPFIKMAERKVIPIDAKISRPFFQYTTPIGEK